jgi:uracil phosphoribosyltransferase
MVTNLSEKNSLVSVWMRELRDVTIQADRARFRKNIERIGQVAAYEISKTFVFTQVQVQTPLAAVLCHVLAVQPVLATILRAGLPLHQGLLSWFDQADSAFVGAYRKHTTGNSFVVEQGYLACPDLTARPLILADPMLATGASMVQTLTALLENGTPSQLHIVSVVASPEGVEEVLQSFPEAHIWVGAIDSGLNAEQYIVPGLGDAGDLCFGEKKQH